MPPPDGSILPDYALHPRGVARSELAARRRRAIPELAGEELELMREACRLGREVLDIAGRAVRPGVTGDEIDRVVWEACAQRKLYPSPLGYNGFPKSVCVSPNEVICHGIPDQRPLAEGDIVNLDVSVFHKGLHSDLNEMFFVGKCDEESHRLVRASYDALRAAAAAIKPGTLYRDLGNIICDVCAEAGCTSVSAFCGHGVGRLFHGPPDVPHYRRNKAVGVMKPGHVFTVEPMLNIGKSGKARLWPDDWTQVTTNGKRSAQFEHTFLVTEAGVEVLTARVGAERHCMPEYDAAVFQRWPTHLAAMRAAWAEPLRTAGSDSEGGGAAGPAPRARGCGRGGGSACGLAGAALLAYLAACAATHRPELGPESAGCCVATYEPAACVAACRPGPSPGRPALRWSQLYSMGELGSDLFGNAPGLPAGDMTGATDTLNHMGKSLDDFSDDVDKFADKANFTLGAIGSMADTMSSNKTKLPACTSNEEEFLGMCYSCSLLTNGIYSYRILPNACCKANNESSGCASFQPSGVTYKAPLPGYGYTVAEDGKFPHPTGACDDNEEGHLGWCFKTCNELTNGAYKYRVMANTCCKQKPCWNIFNLKTKLGICSGFAVGGGKNGHDCPRPREHVNSTSDDFSSVMNDFGDLWKKR
ncbi:unnamed protein product [Prorocentrum cordatum]|uniref:Methionine aminopeptidase n=1 Tax=Prorocentrum cordatum TaxID=2364126 RepID=A0ABN9V5P9_9DINO|nr:unnamed protein product [Polarella glacialis]